MKKLFIRSVAVVCCLILLMASIGCSKSSEKGKDSGNSSNKNVSTESVKTALKYDANENLDLEGKTLSISVWGGVVAEGDDE